MMLFNLAWKLKHKLMHIKYKYYILRGDGKKADEIYFQCLKDIALYIDHFVKPIGEKES